MGLPVNACGFGGCVVRRIDFHQCSVHPHCRTSAGNQVTGRARHAEKISSVYLVMLLVVAHHRDFVDVTESEVFVV